MAQWTYPNCANAVDKDFTVTQVVGRTNDASIDSPVKMDFQLDAEGNVDIYYVERMGGVKYFNGKAKTVKSIGTIDVKTDNEDGLVGVALDPDFKNKNRMFVFYSHTTGFRISRFDLNPSTHVMNPASEKVLITIPSGRGRWHTSGAMRFDAYGDLWINVGDNETTRKGPANTADFRGGILRIHPKEDGTYSIPAGNMWEFAAKYFTDKNQPAVAAKYRDSLQMRREIYVKGTRNAYTLSLDPVRRWAAYGDCGPDQASGTATDTTEWTEEHNVVTEPSFRGWPFWTAIRHVQAEYPPGYDEPGENGANWGDWSKLDQNAPINDHPDAAGVNELLPVVPGTHSYAHSCAMTGPIYRYDGDLNSPGKLPPHFNRIWFVTDFNKGTIQGIHLTDDGKMVGKAVDVFAGLSTSLNRPIDFQTGPDGALYYLNHSCGTWNTTDACSGVYRIAYKGTCQDANLKLETPVVATRARALANSIIFAPDIVSVHGVGGHALEIMDLSGRVIFALSGEGEHEYSFARLLNEKPRGLYFVRVTNAEGSLSRKVAYFPNSLR